MQNPFHRHQFSSATDSINWSEKQILQGILETEAESRRTAAMQTHVWGNNGRVFENESCWLCFITLIFSSFDLFFNIKNKPPAPKKKKKRKQGKKKKAIFPVTLTWNKEKLGWNEACAPGAWSKVKLKHLNTFHWRTRLAQSPPKKG